MQLLSRFGGSRECVQFAEGKVRQFEERSNVKRNVKAEITASTVVRLSAAIGFSGSVDADCG